MYEYIITFGQEVETVWRRKMNVTSLLVVTTRWVLVLIQVTAWLASWPKVRLCAFFAREPFLTSAFLEVRADSAGRYSR